MRRLLARIILKIIEPEIETYVTRRLLDFADYHSDVLQFSAPPPPIVRGEVYDVKTGAPIPSSGSPAQHPAR